MEQCSSLSVQISASMMDNLCQIVYIFPLILLGKKKIGKRDFRDITYTKLKIFFEHFLLGPQTEARVLSQFVVRKLQLIVKQGVLCKLLGKCIIVKVRFVNTGLWQTLFTVRVALII